MPLYTGIVGRPAGQIVPLVSTSKLSKPISVAGVLSCSGWSIDYANATFWASSDGIWHMRLHFHSTINAGNSGGAAITFSLAGVTFINATNAYQVGGGLAYHTANSDYACAVQAMIGTSNIVIYSTNNVTVVGASVEARLNAEPTWASLGTSWASIAEAPGDVYTYIPLADASTSGLLSPAAQAIGGPKTFLNSITGYHTLPKRARAYLKTSDQVCSAGSYTTIIFNNDSDTGYEDPNNNFNTTTGVYTVPETGVYLVTYSLMIVTGTTTSMLASRTLINASGFGYTELKDLVAAKEYMLGTTNYHPLNAGDTVAVQVFPTTVSATVKTIYSYVSIIKIGDL